MPTWHPDQYLLFEEERTQPCRDLVGGIRKQRVGTIIDLGCGPGNSTAVLAERWPAAQITGLDSSAEMINRARASNPRIEWIQAGIAQWAADSHPKYDIVFSNAALQWVDDHSHIYPRLLNRVSPGGVLAVQMPANMNDAAHRIMRHLASSDGWKRRLNASEVREWFVQNTDYYYDLLAPLAQTLRIWETTYLQVMPDAASIAEWYKGTGLRPFLDRLASDIEREEFLEDYTHRLRAEYKPRPDGRVLFPFRRLFLIAGN